MAIELEMIDGVGSSTTYHRISEVKYDFEKNQLSVLVKSYTNESYRDIEKTQLEQMLADIVLYYELTGKEELNEEERAKLQSLNIQELEALKIENKSKNSFLVTIAIDSDIRESIYDKLSQLILFEQGVKI